jgi:hypothetical protein
MDTSTTSPATPPSDEQVPSRQIDAAVAQPGRKPWVDVCGATILALATMASAWCAYQSSRWSGVQMFLLAEAAKADRDAATRDVEAVEFRAFDATMLLHFLEMRQAGHTQLAAQLHDRFRPDAKAAIDAWLAMDPFNNPRAPRGPFLLPQYAQAERLETQSLREQAARSHDAAQQANRRSDDYVLLTVLFSAVLFCGGIAATIDQPGPLHWSMHILALVLFLTTGGFLATLPICRD